MTKLIKGIIENSTAPGPMPKRFLVLCPQGFGDALEATPMLSELRRLEPNAVIDVVVTQKAPQLLFESLPALVDSVIYLRLWEVGRRQFVLDLIAKRWRKPYDIALLCYPAARPEYHVLSFAFPARRRVAHAYGPVTPGSLLWLQSDLCELRAEHNVLRNLGLLRRAGLNPKTPSDYTVPHSWKAAPGQKLLKQIAMHVGTVAHHGRESRRWPLDYFAELGRLCIADGYGVHLVVGPNEIEESRYVQDRAPGTKLFSGALDEVGRFLSSVSLVVTNDNGIGHLAAGVGGHVVSLFGPTPLEHAPYGTYSYPLRLSGCEPCFDIRKLYSKCERNVDFECLKRDMLPRQVFEFVRARLRLDERVTIDLTSSAAG